MSFVKRDEKYSVEIIKNGIKDEFGDRLYEYKIITSEPKQEVFKYCTEKLQPGFIKERRPNPFSPEVIEFHLLTNVGATFMFKYVVKKYTTS